MATIRTAIELTDNFTGILNHVISSVNLGLSAMEQLHETMNVPIDASLEGARESIHQATAAVRELDALMQGLHTPTQEPIKTEQTSTPIHLPAVIDAPEPLVEPSEPVRVPVEWQSYEGIDVFTNTGVERFQQEMQSANNMLNTLNQTQSRIAETAAQTDLFPANAITDINSMQNRLQALQQRLQTIENNPVNLGSSRANTELERLRGQLNQAIQEQRNLNHAVDNMDVQAANEAYLRLAQTIGATERYLRDTIDEQQRFNQEVRNVHSPITQATSGFKAWQTAIITANHALSLVRNTLGRLGFTDITGAFQRIDTMDRFQRIITIMTGDSEQAAAALSNLKDMTVGTAYGLDMAAKATQGFLTRGMSLGTAVDQVRIWTDAVSFYGKGTTEQAENVIDAVGKIYSKGTVEAMQIDRLFDAGIGAAEMYAKAVGRTVGEVKKDLTDRKISSGEFLSVVTQALDQGVSHGAAKEAGNTWATTFANVKAAVTRGWVSVIQSIDEALASHGLPSAMESITIFGQKAEAALNNVGSAVGSIVDFAVTAGQFLGNTADFIADHWAFISPVVYGAAAAVAVYTTCLLMHNIAVAAAKGLTMLLSAKLYLIVGAVVFLITALVNLCNWIAKTTGFAESGLSLICGAVAFVAAAIYNIIVGLINGILQMWWNSFAFPIVQIGEWVLNVMNGGFDSFGDAVANLIGQIISWFLSLGKVVTKIIDTIFGTDWTAGLTSLQDTVTSWGKNETAITFHREAPEIKRIAYKDAFQFGADWGDNISNKVSGMITRFMDQFQNQKDDEKDEDTKFDDLLGNVNDLVGNTEKIADSLDITKEDLKYLRDIAGRDVINKFTTAKISVKMDNNNTINKDMDLDGLFEGMRMKMEQEMSAVAELVHF